MTTIPAQGYLGLLLECGYYTAVVNRTYGLTESLSWLPSFYTCYHTTKSLLRAIIGPQEHFRIYCPKVQKSLKYFTRTFVEG
jgi:hypothetical protein